MQVFLSWSGTESRRAAEAIKPWLQTLFPGLSVWMSDHDLDAGAPWGTALHEQLKLADFGLLCLTAENLTAPWILYEAGALAIASRDGCVVPYLIDVGPEQLPAPLSQFQSAAADRDGTWKLVRTLNAALEERVTEERLAQSFQQAWPALAGALGLTIRTVLHEDVMVVTPSISGMQDEEAAVLLREKMKALLKEGHRRIVVDMVEVTFLSSAALTFVFPGLAAGRRNEAEVVLANLTPEVRPIFELTRLLDIVPNFSTLNEALDYFRTRPLSSGE